MSDLNCVTFTGRLGNDPEVKHLPSGVAVCELSMAVSRKWKDKNSGQVREETAWVPVALFGRIAEIAGEYLSKGSQAGISGKFGFDRWEDKQTGQKRSKLKVIADQLTLISGRDGGSGGGGGQRRSDPVTDDFYRDSSSNQSGGDFPDDEVPF